MPRKPRQLPAQNIVGFSDAEIQEYQKVIESSAEQIMHLAASSKG